VAFRLTADVSVEGRSGIAGANKEVEEDDKAEDCGVDAEKPVEAATEDDMAGEFVTVSAIVIRR
jgi:hypothetical protein